MRVVVGVVVLVVRAKAPLPLQPLLGLAWSPVCVRGECGCALVRSCGERGRGSTVQHTDESCLMGLLGAGEVEAKACLVT